MTIQAGWTDQMKVYKFKTTSHPPPETGCVSLGNMCVWNGDALLENSSANISRVSASMKYYTLKQCKDETDLAFLYRMNLAAERANVKFRKSERRREQHIKRFIKNLTNMSLKLTLQSQRFYQVSDLEYVLKQQEEVNLIGNYSTRSHPNRDFRADNVARGGMTQRNLNRAYVARRMRTRTSRNLPRLRENTTIQDACIADNPKGVFLGKEDLIHEVYRIMNNAGWKPANPNTGSGLNANSRPPVLSPVEQAAFQRYQPHNNHDRLEFCEKCRKFGHRPEQCWTDLICGCSRRRDLICGCSRRRGLPTRSCTTKSCPKCEEYHDGRCDEWEAFQEIKKLVLQGGLADLPSHIREDILNGKNDSERVQLNR
ncbi:LOW QUALITY PROTEIN: hypothetical protein PHMEG_00020937 [Phytophthora megakarya]|uniref:Eukaryotic/viral aspartic protease n=1 Tax=Phytophthora megakarya TaxID=4795 RepID=A0A225VMN0_9STRA|nr:LOW QUALITY PROTEIN: hypothetical protein PHMEG_00020937 [Phytophthora megakarya]